MLRLVVFLIGIAVAATGLSWLADRPGSLLINWQGYEIETSVFRAVVMLAFLIGVSILLWSITTALWRSPASIGMFFTRRRQMRGLEALSGGMIAIGAGDRDTATRFAVQARKALPNEPLTQLLRAQAAQLNGDRATSRRMFEAMLAQPETEQLGLRGLFLEAEREGEREAARQFAERSVELNPKLGWAVDALFELQSKDSDWAGALRTLSIAQKHQHHDKDVLARRRAVLMTARAQALEETDPNRAMNLAIEAHHLAHDLVPAAALAGRMLAARGHTKRAAKIIERTWRRQPHPDLATVYAHVRLGDSPTDRLLRVKRLAQLNPHSIETPVAIASAAIEAKEWQLARQALAPLEQSKFTQRVCTLMARIEAEQNADKGRAREWLARAVHAPRDPAWVADGIVSDKWAPVSPVTGTFDAFRWRVPADALDAADTDLIAARLDELVKLGASVAEPTPPLLEPDEPRARYTDDIEPARDQSGRQSAPFAARREAAEQARPKDSGDSSQSERTAVRLEKPAPARPGIAEVSIRPSVVREVTQPADSKVVEVKIVDGRTSSNQTSSDKTAGDKKPLEPNMFIAPRADDSAKASADPDNGSDARVKPPRAAASGQG